MGGDINDPGIVGKTINRSVALSDTVGFVDDRILVTYGLRKQTLKVDGWNYKGTRSAAYDESITTPVYGIVLNRGTTFRCMPTASKGWLKARPHPRLRVAARWPMLAKYLPPRAPSR